MRAIQFTGPRAMRFVDDVPMPEPDEGQVLVRNTHIGLCGSNRGPYLGEGYWGEADYPNKPGWTGHENIGIIEKSRNPDWAEGDYVLAQARGYDGFTEYMACQPHSLSRLPRQKEGMNMGDYVVAQPLATVMAALSKTRPPLGQTCAVVGQGPIGLIFTYVLRKMGAVQVIAIDPVRWRLEWSKRFGATHFVPMSKTNDVVAMVNALTQGERVDVAVEAVGHEETYITAAYLPKHEGRLFPFGVPDFRLLNFPWERTTGNETEIIISRGQRWTEFAQAAIKLIDGPYADLKALATPTMPWDAAQQAFEMYAFPQDFPDSLKIILEL